jgi:hypothetical protein
MSAEQSARSVRQADGLDPVRALQRVLYRSAKQDPKRRFHALYDKLARSDVMWPNPGSVEAATTSISGRQTGPWPQFGQGSRTHTTWVRRS